MLTEISKLIPKEDGPERLTTTVAHKVVHDLWRGALSDFEKTVGSTLAEMQMTALLREKERMGSRLDQFIDVAESLYLLLIGPLPPELSDDAALISRLQKEATALRSNLVTAQHRLALRPDELDVHHVSTYGLTIASS